MPQTRPSLIVFSHPNHELAIYGLLQRLRPFLLYLTDGGGRQRLEQTLEGLQRIGLTNNAIFLNHTEQSFYDALLARDSSFFKQVANEVRATIQKLNPGQLFCDAIEFYNPVHDLSLPIVQSALRDLPVRCLFEVPLIYQTADKNETYEVQRFPAARASDQLRVQLTEEQTDAKLRARDGIYSCLVEQMGPVISDLPREHVAMEVWAAARPSPPAPAKDVTLRYERRARMLAERGEIAKQITFKKHYQPVVASL